MTHSDDEQKTARGNKKLIGNGQVRLQKEPLGPVVSGCDQAPVNRPVRGTLEQRDGSRFIAMLPRAIGDAELERAFGPPLLDDPGAIDAGEKTCREWVLVFGCGTVATVYDYRTRGSYRVGGFSQWAAELIFSTLGLL